MRSLPNTVAALFLFLFSANSFAADLFDMLKRMSDADQNQNYQGTFILRKSDKLSALHVTHGVDEKGVWESLEALNGEPRKVLRHNNRVISIFPDREIITIRHNDKKKPLHPQLPDNIEQFDLSSEIQKRGGRGHDLQPFFNIFFRPVIRSIPLTFYV